IVEHHQRYAVGAVAGILTALAIGLAFERLAVWPLRAASRVTVAVATLGLLSLMVALELTVFGLLPRQLAPPLGGRGVRIFHVIVSPTQIVSLVLVAVVALALAAFLRGTDFGLSVRAAAQD